MTIHVNRPLTDVLVQYTQNPANAGGSMCFPELPVAHKSDLFYTVPKGDFFRDDVKEVQPGDETEGVSMTPSTTPFLCKTRGLHVDITDEDRENEDEAIDLDTLSTDLLAAKFVLNREITWASTFFKSGVWTDIQGMAASPSTAQFLAFNKDGSDPFKAIMTGILAMEEKTGYRPNCAVAGAKVEGALLNNAAITDRIKYTQRGIITRDMLAGLFGLDRFLVSGLTKNTAKKGATDSMSYVAGNHLLLCYVAPKPGMRVPSAGYRFRWRNVPGSQDGYRVRKIRLENKELDRIEGKTSYTEQVICADLGYMMLDAYKLTD